MDVRDFISYLASLEHKRRRNMELYDKKFRNNNNVEDQQERDLFRLTDEYFQSCFGLPKKIVQELLEELYMRTFYIPEQDPFTSSDIPFDIRVLATLSYLVHGHLEQFMSLPYAFLRNYSKFKLMRCVVRECETIVLFLTPTLVTFPYTKEQVSINKRSFLETFGLPGVIGVLDCFFVCLQCVPLDQRKLYINRHGHTAINVQVICDNNYRFLDVNARFSGITADVYIWNRSHVQQIVRNLHLRDPNTWLIADRGYRLDSFLMNPYRNATTPEQKALNATFKNVHETLDKAIAILKARFSCLKTELPFNHQQCANIITACVTLHNYLIAKRYPIEEKIIYSIPKTLELPNAKFEDTSKEGNVNRKCLADLQCSYHSFCQVIISKNLQTHSN